MLDLAAADFFSSFSFFFSSLALALFSLSSLSFSFFSCLAISFCLDFSSFSIFFFCFSEVITGSSISIGDRTCLGESSK